MGVAVEEDQEAVEAVLQEVDVELVAEGEALVEARRATNGEVNNSGVVSNKVATSKTALNNGVSNNRLGGSSSSRNGGQIAGNKGVSKQLFFVLMIMCSEFR